MHALKFVFSSQTVLDAVTPEIDRKAVDRGTRTLEVSVGTRLLRQWSICEITKGEKIHDDRGRFAMEGCGVGFSVCTSTQELGFV